MKESIFSFFNAPITNQVPNGVVCISQMHAYITTNEWLRERTDRVRAAGNDPKRFASLKRGLLPYVTPAGVFSYRKEDHLLVPSGEFVIDIDHLPSPEEATRWRDTLFEDERLRPDLAFISPSATGVKLIVPYRLSFRRGTEIRLGIPQVEIRPGSRRLKRRPCPRLLPLPRSFGVTA